jgi:hypothetical protein
MACVCVCVCIRVNTCALYKSVGKQRKQLAAPSATPSGHQPEKCMVFLNSQNQCSVLPVDGIVKLNGPCSQFPVNRDFKIIQCWISQLLLYLGKCKDEWKRPEKKYEEE